MDPDSMSQPVAEDQQFIGIIPDAISEISDDRSEGALRKNRRTSLVVADAQQQLCHLHADVQRVDTFLAEAEALLAAGRGARPDRRSLQLCHNGTWLGDEAAMPAEPGLSGDGAVGEAQGEGAGNLPSAASCLRRRSVVTFHCPPLDREAAGSGDATLSPDTIPRLGPSPYPGSSAGPVFDRGDWAAGYNTHPFPRAPQVARANSFNPGPILRARSFRERSLGAGALTAASAGLLRRASGYGVGDCAGLNPLPRSSKLLLAASTAAPPVLVRSPSRSSADGTEPAALQRSPTAELATAPVAVSAGGGERGGRIRAMLTGLLRRTTAGAEQQAPLSASPLSAQRRRSLAVTGVGAAARSPQALNGMGQADASAAAAEGLRRSESSSGAALRGLGISRSISVSGASPLVPTQTSSPGASPYASAGRAHAAAPQSNILGAVGALGRSGVDGGELAAALPGQRSPLLPALGRARSSVTASSVAMAAAAWA
ncbi:hypothetical protein HYH03_000688 [Edaphochlamys debaryana]|uniref:Uncharacterized protein n=1 Tax=Edaphochlamys debaryana TaxID=47281 RepID=A0A835YFZ3_9CHLO|nr:hypothetical protein HYH03_000688 [Edaphochlamys debaryana]|eukprot:KAG2502202.1 hypothetical protein HYH03_000688 [Edaphochlamys debaryana]